MWFNGDHHLGCESCTFCAALPQASSSFCCQVCPPGFIIINLMSPPAARLQCTHSGSRVFPNARLCEIRFAGCVRRTKNSEAKGLQWPKTGLAKGLPGMLWNSLTKMLGKAMQSCCDVVIGNKTIISSSDGLHPSSVLATVVMAPTSFLLFLATFCYILLLVTSNSNSMIFANKPVVFVS